MSMPTNKEINVPYKTNTVEKYPYIVYAEIENKLKFLEGSIDELESSLPSTAFTDTNTVKKYIDDEVSDVADLLPASAFDSDNTVHDALTEIKDVLPFNDFNSTNTIKNYIDDSKEFACNETSVDYILTEPTWIMGGTNSPGTYSQGSVVDLVNRILYIAEISKGDGIVPSNYGYIKAYDITTGTLLRTTEQIQIYHANSIDLRNGYLYVNAVKNSNIFKVDPSTLEIVSTFSPWQQGEFAALSFDETNKRMFMLAHGQSPVVYGLVEAANNVYQISDSFKWNLSGFQYNQGMCARSGIIAMPCWKLQPINKSFISLFDYNHCYIGTINVKGNMEIEDVTIDTSNHLIYFTTTGQQLYSIPYDLTTTIQPLNQFKYNDEYYAFWLNRNISTQTNYVAKPSKYMTTSIPLSIPNVSGGRPNSVLKIEIEYGGIIYTHKFLNFNPETDSNRNFEIFFPYYTNSKIYLIGLIFNLKYDKTARTLSIDTTKGGIFNINITDNLSSYYTMNEFLTGSTQTIAHDLNFDIIKVTWKPIMNGGYLNNAAMYYTIS